MIVERTTVVDFVARGDAPDEWRMVLVEEGPWVDAIDNQVRRVQARLYGCIDAALEGQLAEKFPESNGKKVVIQLDCYNLPKTEVAEFFERFAKGVFSTPAYKQALENNRFVTDISFHAKFESFN